MKISVWRFDGYETLEPMAFLYHAPDAALLILGGQGTRALVSEAAFLQALCEGAGRAALSQMFMC